jgi:hypothetical protein
MGRTDVGTHHLGKAIDTPAFARTPTHPGYRQAASYRHLGRTPRAMKDAIGNAFTAF